MNLDSSFEKIYQELFPVMYRFVSIRVPKNDIEDIIAEVMTKVWKALPKFQGKSSIRSWALRIAYNHVVDYYRSRKKATVISLYEELINQAEDDYSEQLVTLLSVGQALTKLSESQVAVIQLRLVEGFNASETAEILGTSQQAVDSLLYRAKKNFRRIYKVDN